MKHTKEPWEVLEGSHIIIADKFPIVDCAGPNKYADAERIVACVNALQGVKDPAGFIADLKYAVELTQRYWEGRGHRGSLTLEDVNKAVKKARAHLEAK